MGQVLVVGGAGYIGSHVVLALRTHGYPVVVMDNLSTGRRVNLFSDVTFYEGDLRNEDDLDRVFKNEDIAHVIHLAALKAAGDSMLVPSTYAMQNISGTLTLLDHCLSFGVESVIFSSSAAVYGDPEYTPLDEAHPTNPANFYGFTKLEIERILQWYLQLKGLRFAALRYFNAAGYDPDLQVRGLEINPKNLIPLVMEAATGQRSHLEVFGTDYDTRDGSCIRDYIHVTDLAEAHVQAMEYLEHNQRLVCNLGTGVGTTVLEMVQAFEALTGRALNVVRSDRRPGDPPELAASSGFAEKELGWIPKHSSIKSILETTWKVYQLHQPST